MKGILEKIRKKYFSVMWTRKMEKEGTSLVKWKKMEKTKEDGGKRFINIHLFGQALTVKIIMDTIDDCKVYNS
jgi:hypothetical protein